VGASYDALVDLLESIEHFMGRLDIYINFPPTSPTAVMGEIIVNGGITFHHRSRDQADKAETTT
jgi:hypothetical protein